MELQRAQAWTKKVLPVLILIDYPLPDMTVAYFIDYMKKKTVILPCFIVATGVGDERIDVKMMKKGAMDYIVKDSRFF